MRSVALVLFSIVVWGSHGTHAQDGAAAGERANPRERPEEIVVRGQRLAKLRYEVQDARERAYAIFNEINSDDDFDVHCRYERKYHSHTNRRICRARFEDRISAAAATEYMRSLAWSCSASGFDRVDLLQDCLFSAVGQRAADAARAVEGQLPNKREQLDDEILRLANEDDRFARAILDFYDADRQYEEARKRRYD